LLRDAGYDVRTVLEERLGGSADPKVLDACLTERRVLITLDLDFVDLRPQATVASGCCDRARKVSTARLRC